MALSKIFVHHVFFWLKNPGNETDRDALIAGLDSLTRIGTIRQSHIGRPAGTNRAVIETGYSVSWLLFFDSLEDEESYQHDPIHLEFVKTCSHLWSKVVVYDSI